MAVHEAKTTAIEVPDAGQAIIHAGWKMAISPCTLAAADCKSVGVAIGARCHVDMNDSIQAATWPAKIKSRFTLKHIAAVCKGGIHAGSCYLTSCNAGISHPGNLDALQLMAGY